MLCAAQSNKSTVGFRRIRNRIRSRLWLIDTLLLLTHPNIFQKLGSSIPSLTPISAEWLQVVLQVGFAGEYKFNPLRLVREGVAYAVESDGVMLIHI